MRIYQSHDIGCITREPYFKIELSDLEFAHLVWRYQNCTDPGDYYATADGSGVDQTMQAEINKFCKENNLDVDTICRPWNTDDYWEEPEDEIYGQ